MSTLDVAANVQRRLATAAPADRPRKRRSDASPNARAFVRADLSSLVVRSDDGDPAAPLTFRGCASVTERAYTMFDMFGAYEEIVSAGAFTETLSRDGLDVPFVLAHDSLRRIARTTNGTLSLSENDEGLLVEATLDPSDADVAYIAPKLRAGLIDEMSFMFRITSGQWSPDYSEYRINAVDMHRGDVAIVGYGANPHTSGALRHDTTTARRTRRVYIPEDYTRHRVD